MASPAALPVVRVKRRIDEEPLSAFVLNCKKLKLECEADEKKDEISTILKFAGTVESQHNHEPITALSRLTKDEAKEIVQKTRKPNVTEKSRQEMRQHLHENRFKVVNCSRAIDMTDVDSQESKEITIVDIEKHPKPNEGENSNSTAVASTSASSSFAYYPPTDGHEFVYDLYIPDENQLMEMENWDLMADDRISIRPFDDLVYEERFADDEETDSEDSNQENFAGNDYPDEEVADDDSINEEDMIRASQDTDLDRDNELSSDDGDVNGFVYSIDPEEVGFEDDVDLCDVNRYGLAYATYKARQLKVGHDDSDDEDWDEYYDEASDPDK